MTAEMKKAQRHILEILTQLQRVAQQQVLGVGEVELSNVCAQFSKMVALLEEAAPQLQWMITHFDLERENSDLDSGISPELKASKEVLAKIEELLNV